MAIHLTRKQQEDIRLATQALSRPKCPDCGGAHLSDDEMDAVSNAIAIQSELGRDYPAAYKEAIADGDSI